MIESQAELEQVDECFLDTKELDGETNLKLKLPPK